jgi:hypothetical protein
MKRRPITQQTIVFTIFVLMFAGFGLFLPGFLTAGNLLGCCRTWPSSASSAWRWRSS